MIADVTATRCYSLSFPCLSHMYKVIAFSLQKSRATRPSSAPIKRSPANNESVAERPNSPRRKPRALSATVQVSSARRRELKHKWLFFLITYSSVFGWRDSLHLWRYIRFNILVWLIFFAKSSGLKIMGISESVEIIFVFLWPDSLVWMFYVALETPSSLRKGGENLAWVTCRTVSVKFTWF